MMRAVERILGVFESFTPEADSLTLQEIADRIELPKSTAFRIVQSLEKAGYLVRLENQQYTLSFRFTRLAGLVKSTLSIREIAHPIMVELAEKAKETISLHTVSGKSRVCIDAVNADSPLRSVTRAGDQVPLLQGSAARVLMAHMPQDQLSPLVTQMVKATKKTKAQVLQELALTREQGYSISHGERLLGVSAISAPIKDVHEEVHYCLSLGGPTVRVQLHEKEFTKLLVKAASSISRLYGARLTQQSS
jgi:DNA-binding IclR family transcriptional regulator